MKRVLISLWISVKRDKVFPLIGEASIPDKLTTAKELAECLAHDNLTLSVLRNGKIVLIMVKMLTQRFRSLLLEPAL